MPPIDSACKHAEPVKVMLSSNASCCSVIGPSTRVSGSHGQLDACLHHTWHHLPHCTSALHLHFAMSGSTLPC